MDPVRTFSLIPHTQSVGDDVQSLSVDLDENQVVTIGRDRGSIWHLPLRELSRRHARLRINDSLATIADVGSRHGTLVNGIALDVGVHVPLEDGDHVAFGIFQCIVRVTAGNAARDGETLSGIPRTTGTHARLESDGSEGSITFHPHEEIAGFESERLKLVLDATTAMASAASTHDVANITIQTIGHLANCSRNAVLQPDADDAFTVIASSPSAGDLVFSQSLLREAMKGQLVELRSGFDAVDHAHSVLSLGIKSALCLPIMVANHVDSLVYIDTRHTERVIESASVAFCNAIVHVAGLAIERLHAAELAARRRVLDDDLNIARDAQRMLLPPRTGTAASTTYAYEALPGRLVAGDFFDILSLSDGSTAFFLGDVSGKGVGAGLLMAATQSHLRAALASGSSLAEAVAVVNRHITRRSSDDKFVTLMIARWIPADGVLEMVDAGHGFTVVIAPDGSATSLRQSGGIPIGIIDDHPYAATSTELTAGSRVILFSDGAVEQADPAGTMFELQGVIDAVTTDPTTDSGEHATMRDVEAIVNAVKTHAAGPLADDLTVASIQIDR